MQHIQEKVHGSDIKQVSLRLRIRSRLFYFMRRGM